MNNRNDPSQSPEQSHKQRQDFDDRANDLWSLYGTEAEIYDESRIKSLKSDMDGVLIFVRTCFPSYQPQRLTSYIPGWFILCCSHGVRRPEDHGFESKLCRTVSLLPRAICSDALSNIATNRFSGRPDLSQFFYPIALPDILSNGI